MNYEDPRIEEKERMLQSQLTSINSPNIEHDQPDAQPMNEETT